MPNRTQRNKQQEQQQHRLQRNIEQAKRNEADMRATAKTRPPKKPKSKPTTKAAPKQGGLKSSLFKRIFGRSEPPQSAQQSISYREMFRDGLHQPSFASARHKNIACVDNTGGLFASNGLCPDILATADLKGTGFAFSGIEQTRRAVTISDTPMFKFVVHSRV